MHALNNARVRYSSKIIKKGDKCHFGENEFAPFSHSYYLPETVRKKLHCAVCFN